jgi:hypothetical protein
MFKSINVEAEGQELILSNTHGDKVIIPRDKREWVKNKMQQGCHDCIDKLVATLPTVQNYAKDGSVYPAVNLTKLDPTEETSYNEWKSKLPTRLQSEVDYDLKGFWKENKNWSPENPNSHMTDKFKLPNHPTFSNESQYYNPKTQKYGGSWQPTDFGVVYKANNLGLKKDKVEFNLRVDTKDKVVLQTKDGYKLLPTSSQEYKDAYSKGVGYFDNQGVFVTNKSELPEFTVTNTSLPNKSVYNESIKK